MIALVILLNIILHNPKPKPVEIPFRDSDYIKQIQPLKPIEQPKLVTYTALAKKTVTVANYASGSTIWDKLAQCESGGNWAINTGNGYYGGLQFNLSTWKSNGGTGYPHQHSRSEQIRVAEKLRAARGYSPWPACARKLGLL